MVQDNEFSFRHAEFKIGILCLDGYIRYVFRNRGGGLGVCK